MLSRRPLLLPVGERSAHLMDGEEGGAGWRGGDGCWLGPIYFSQGPFHVGPESNSIPSLPHWPNPHTEKRSRGGSPLRHVCLYDRRYEKRTPVFGLYAADDLYTAGCFPMVHYISGV